MSVLIETNSTMQTITGSEQHRLVMLPFVV